MAQVSFPLTTYQLPSGVPVADGSLVVRLNADGQVGTSQIASNPVRLPLDANGTLSTSYLFWSNSNIAPTGTYYIYSVYTSDGEMISGPNLITL